MNYHSTRTKNNLVDSAEAVIQGITPDGGLFVPQQIPQLDWASLLNCESLEIQSKILSAFLPDIDNMDSLVHKAYEDKFDCEELTPTKSVGDMHVLELFHGPTYAFKDVALCMLPQLLTAALKKKNQTKEVRIITATSGDTGKAALEGFKDVENISICVFFPHEGVSQIQKKQMITQRGNNVHVAAVKGNFDDIQSEVKKIFVSNKCSETNYNLSSANSINIGRLTPQIMYYFKAYSDLIADGTIACGDKVNFSVPTGNFGDILAGFLAMKLGLPINKLICASNANNVLTDFINTGAYNKCRSLVKTSSPSMDILISSNLERLLYFLCEDVDCVAKLMNDLDEKGQYQISKTMLDDIQALFWGEYCDNQQTQDVIGRVYNSYKYLCDPHTSCGWFAAEQYRNKTNDKTPMVVLSTASPYKFPAAVLAALGLESTSDGMEQLDILNKHTGLEIPQNLKNLKTLPELHNDVIEIDQMLGFSLS